MNIPLKTLMKIHPEISYEYADEISEMKTFLKITLRYIRENILFNTNND